MKNVYFISIPLGLTISDDIPFVMHHYMLIFIRYVHAQPSSYLYYDIIQKYTIL